MMAVRPVHAACRQTLSSRLLQPTSSITGRTLWRRMCCGTSHPPPITSFTQEEELMRDSVARFARERVQPLVSKMDQESQMEPSLISDMFEQGVSVIYCRCMTKCVCV